VGFERVLLALVVAAALSPLSQSEGRLLRVRDALLRIEDVDGPVVPVLHQGATQLFLERGARHAKEARIDVVSVHAPEARRTVWSGARPFAWDVGDADADETPEVLVGLPRAGTGGELRLVSGASGAHLRVHSAENGHDRFGASLAFLGDVDGDGCADYAASAPQLAGRPIAGGWSVRDSSGTLGWVRVFSGADGKELWRTSGLADDQGFGSHVAALGDLDGDGSPDLLAQAHPGSDDPLVLLSGASGKVIAHVPHRGWWAGAAGDLDADGVPDLFLETGDSEGSERFGSPTFLSGRSRQPLFDLRGRPGQLWTSGEGSIAALGDLDGDGHDDVGLGLASAEALRLEPDGREVPCSGCVLVLSGRTHEVFLGVYGEPGTRAGLGMDLAALPDVSGDGHPDLVVTSWQHAYVFPGPGKR